MRDIRSLGECISKDERKQRSGISLINGLLWLLIAGFSLATFLIPVAVVGLLLLFNMLLSEYNVRQLQASGVAVSKEQFGQIYCALESICARFSITKIPRVIVLNVSQINAFALKFAQRKVIVLFSQTLEGIIDNPAELKFFLGHEIGHLALDYGPRGIFELYRPAAYHAARELTCDNVGLSAAQDLEAARHALKRIGAGNLLADKLNEPSLSQEAAYIYSGFTGWLLRQYLQYPPLGKRIANIVDFAGEAVTL